jgi:hypothetical protein
VRPDGDAPDHDEVDVVLVKCAEQRMEIELRQCTLAAPLMALSCLQSACTRARRSLIGAWRPASRRIARARSSSPMSPLSALTATGSILTVLFAFLALSPPAHATYDPVGSGATKLTLDKAFSAFLKENGISLAAKAGAKRKGSSITLPVTSGNLDPTIGLGEIGQQGTIAFQGAKGKVRSGTSRSKPSKRP